MKKTPNFMVDFIQFTYVLAILKLSIADKKINEDALSIISNDNQVKNSS